MQRESTYREMKVLVVGLARSGSAAARFLHRRGARVRVTDIQEASRLGSFLRDLPEGVATTLGRHERRDFLESDLIVLSPGVPSDLPYLEEARNRGLSVWSEIELAYRHLEGRLTAVTGTNGKTTTTSLIAKILDESGRRAAAAGNVGFPLTECIETEDFAALDDYVVELSSFQLENIEQFRPGVALLLNLSPDHLNRYDSFESYCAAKERILENQTEEDVWITNLDDDLCLDVATRQTRVPLFFSLEKEVEAGCFVRENQVFGRYHGNTRTLFLREELQIRGRHNLANALAAAAAAMTLEVPDAAIREGIRRFRGVPHRLESVGEIGGVRYFNDSKATTVESTMRALEACDERVHLILGGSDKGADFARLYPLVSQRVNRLYLLGETRARLARILRGSAPIRLVGDLEEAVEEASRAALPREVVLLSPACASFDQFRDFEERGETFKRLVARLAEKKSPSPQEVASQ